MSKLIGLIKSYLPPRWKKFFGRLLDYSDQTIKNQIRWITILFGKKPDKGKISIFYGHDNIPMHGEYVHGGLVKFRRMQNLYPNSLRQFNILYMVSSGMPADWLNITRVAKWKGAKIVWNQNGVAYPAWCGQDYEKINTPMKVMIEQADFVFYQSQFAKICADKFLGRRDGGWDILYNSVDTGEFTPAVNDLPLDHLVLLLGGNQFEYYRLNLALETLSCLAKIRKDVRLIVTGKLGWTSAEEANRIAQQRIQELGLADKVFFRGTYPQEDAPDVFRSAHILLHTQYNDVSPGLVIEAMSCGLPVVYLTSGGVTELVGPEAGVGVPVPTSWDKIYLPEPSQMARAVLEVANERGRYAEAARQVAVERFDIHPWLNRHREVFESLL